MRTVTLTFDLAIGQTQTGFTEVYAQSLSVDCDLDLSPSDMVLVHDTSSCHADHLCQIIFKIPVCITNLRVGHKQVSLNLCIKFKCGL